MHFPLGALPRRLLPFPYIIMTTHHTHHPCRAVLALLSAFLFATAASRAVTINETFFQAGIGIGKIDGAAHNADMTTYTGIVNKMVVEGGLVGLDVRASYTYGDITSNIGGSMQDSDVDLILSFPKIPLVKPFLIGGASYDKFALLHNFGPEYGWDFGYNIGVGAELKILPALPVTASIRYTHGDIERVNYQLDASFWFTKFGVGANLSYQTGEGNFDNDISQGYVYLALRF